jgi:hypothetical protein
MDPFSQGDAPGQVNNMYRFGQQNVTQPSTTLRNQADSAENSLPLEVASSTTPPGLPMNQTQLVQAQLDKDSELMPPPPKRQKVDASKRRSQDQGRSASRASDGSTSQDLNARRAEIETKIIQIYKQSAQITSAISSILAKDLGDTNWAAPFTGPNSTTSDIYTAEELFINATLQNAGLIGGPRSLHSVLGSDVVNEILRMWDNGTTAMPRIAESINARKDIEKWTDATDGVVGWMDVLEILSGAGRV